MMVNPLQVGQDGGTTDQGTDGNGAGLAGGKVVRGAGGLLESLAQGGLDGGVGGGRQGLTDGADVGRLALLDGLGDGGAQVLEERRGGGVKLVRQRSDGAGDVGDDVASLGGQSGGETRGGLSGQRGGLGGGQDSLGLELGLRAVSLLVMLAGLCHDWRTTYGGNGGHGEEGDLSEAHLDGSDWVLRWVGDVCVSCVVWRRGRAMDVWMRFEACG